MCERMREKETKEKKHLTNGIHYLVKHSLKLKKKKNILIPRRI